MDVTLHLPVKRFVFKYCDKLFCQDTRWGRSWRLNTHYKEAKFLWALLERIPDRYQRPDSDEEEIHILVPSKIAYSRGSYLTPESVEVFNDYIKQCIMDEILQFHTGVRSRIGIKAIDKVAVNQYAQDRVYRVLKVATREAHKFYWQKQIIADILAKYDITEDELSTDSILKYLQRYSQNRYSA